MLPPQEREPLYEQLALDPRPAVRAVTAEVLAHHGGKPGIADSTLEQKFADANRSIKAT